MYYLSIISKTNKIWGDLNFKIQIKYPGDLKLFTNIN